MSVAEQALWIVERNSKQPLTLNDVAAACGVSRSHLASAFGTATGRPLMNYVRARRLSDAAQELAAGAPDILTVALEYGYGSHEAFTRAFGDHFGRTPEQVRNAGTADGLALTPALKLPIEPVGAPPHMLDELPRRRFVGFSAPSSWGETSSIPSQWQHFISEYYDDIPSKIEQMPVGMCDTPDEEGRFRYIASAEVEEFEDRVADLVCVEMPPQTYAVFEHRSHVSKIFDTYRAIWNEALPAIKRTAADWPSLEFHNDTFDPSTGLGGLRIFIPLAK